MRTNLSSHYISEAQISSSKVVEQRKAPTVLLTHCLNVSFRPSFWSKFTSSSTADLPEDPEDHDQDDFDDIMIEDDVLKKANDYYLWKSCFMNCDQAMNFEIANANDRDRY